MINLISPINSLGYGVAGFNIYKSLASMSGVALWVIGNPEIYTRQDYDIIQEGLKKASVWNNNAPCVKIWHQHDMAQFAGRGKRIGFPFFELDKFSEQEIHSLNSLDSIFVTSEWAKDIILSETNITEVRVVPLGVDRKIFPETDHTYSDKTIFFNCGKWEIRKGHDILVEIFNEAFEKEDNVELWMMCDNPFLKQEDQEQWRKLYKNSKLGEKITIIPRVKTQNEVYSIMSQVDCGLFPSRAEGWNLELLELMSCGKQVIATNYSAHTEFCNKKNCLLINVDNTELAYDGKWFHGKTGNWAEISRSQKDQAVEHLRFVHKNKQKNTEGINTANSLSWSNTARRLLSSV